MSYIDIKLERLPYSVTIPYEHAMSLGQVFLCATSTWVAEMNGLGNSYMLTL